MTENEIYFVSASKQAELIRKKIISPVELIHSYLDRIQSLNPSLNAIVTVSEKAIEQARQAETKVMKGEYLGKLHGVPFTAKDCFDTAGIKTTRGSRLFQNRIPDQDATAVKRLKQAGAILLGKTNLPEFALSAETNNNVFGQTNNPWNLLKTAGGSSGGEASAIAAGLSPLGIGTDLGGSNRLPAHYCGIVGFKPTHGRIPLTGQWPELMSRYMHVGSLNRSVKDAALTLSVLLGPDGQDPYAVPVVDPDISTIDLHNPQLKIGWIAEGPFQPVAQTIQKAVADAASVLKNHGWIVEPVSLDKWKQNKPINLVMDLLIAEAPHYFEQLIEGKHDQLTAPIQQLLGTPLPSIQDYIRALAGCEQLRHDMIKHFSTFDILLLPTAPMTAPIHDAVSHSINGKTAPPIHGASITPAFGITGSPAISIPFTQSPDGLPIGVQLVAAHFNESKLFQAAIALEKNTGTRFHRPPQF